MAVLTDNVAQRRTEARQRWDAKTGADLYITVGMGTCGLAAGAQDTLTAIEAELERRGLRAAISQVGCVGMCSYEPMIELQAATKGRMNYGQATAEIVPEIFAAYFDGAPLDERRRRRRGRARRHGRGRPHAAIPQLSSTPRNTTASPSSRSSCASCSATAA